MLLLYAGLLGAMATGGQGRPAIHKLGTIDCDLVESTPVVYQGRLYRFEWVRWRYKHNYFGKRNYYRLLDVETARWVGPFGLDHCFGCAYAEGQRLWVHGVPKGDSDRIDVFWSDDLNQWHSATALKLPGWGIFNTSVCKGPEGYIMAFEIGKPADIAGHPFTTCFARSDDLVHWELLDPHRYVYSRDRYTACPSLRYVRGWYYMIYLEALRGGYAPYIVRSRDLVSWESSPFNPIMRWGDEDKRIANPRLTAAEREHIAGARNINNSDVDLAEWQGEVVIYYSWGNQHGTEFLAEARYKGTLGQFLEAWFPAETQP
ncbi:MAG: hypothetical protein J7M26_00730 [Armatimonadetes bacterium]|nr:hypothetical protein [Armatimonadota bacterium]